MSTPHLRVLPNPTAEAMEQLGATIIAGVLGTYRDCLDERHRLFHELLSENVGDVESYTEHSRELFKRWRAAERRLALYKLLADEVELVLGAVT